MPTLARYDGLADWYDAEFARPAEDARAIALRLLGEGPGRLIDVGCGTGAHTAAFEEHGWTAVGVDVSDDQLRLARRLKFYADLMAALGKRDITRPRHQTPLEFAGTLTFLPTEAYDAVHHLTDFFYRVRFGRQDLPPDEQRRLATLVTEVEALLPAVP